MVSPLDRNFQKCSIYAPEAMGDRPLKISALRIADNHHPGFVVGSIDGWHSP
jgi:hypothetical protein